MDHIIYDSYDVSHISLNANRWLTKSNLNVGIEYDVEECDEDPTYCLDIREDKIDKLVKCRDSNKQSFDLDVGTICELKCKNGTLPTSSSGDTEVTKVTCLEDGEWSDELSDCKKPCDDLNVPNAGIFCR